jgi:hypothetical protein
MDCLIWQKWEEYEKQFSYKAQDSLVLWITRAALEAHFSSLRCKVGGGHILRPFSKDNQDREFLRNFGARVLETAALLVFVSPTM